MESAQSSAVGRRHTPLAAAALRFALVLCALAVGLALVAWLAREAPAPARQRFDRKPLWAVRANKPEYILIGNSMVNTRFDEPTLNRMLAPMRAKVVAQDGARSAMYYAMFKNYVVASRHRPRRVLFFFRNFELTAPRARIDGNGALRLQRVSHADEPVIRARLQPPLTEPIARLRFVLAEEVPVQRLRDRVNPLVDGFGLWLASALGTPSAKDLKAEINEVFSGGNLRPTSDAKDAPDPMSRPVEQRFSELVESSFLPDILALAEDNAIPISFVRVRTRAAAWGEPESAELSRYQSELRAYFAARGIPFFDMTGAVWESQRFYGTGDHVNPKFKRKYTGLFVANMRQAFE